MRVSPIFGQSHTTAELLKSFSCNKKRCPSGQLQDKPPQQSWVESNGMCAFYLLVSHHVGLADDTLRDSGDMLDLQAWPFLDVDVLPIAASFCLD